MPLDKNAGTDIPFDKKTTPKLLESERVRAHGQHRHFDGQRSAFPRTDEVCVCVCVCACVRVCVYVHARMYACFMRVCMRVCVYACFCLYVCMHARRTMSPMGAAFWLDRTIHPLGGAAVGEDFQRGWRARWRWGWHHPS